MPNLNLKNFAKIKDSDFDIQDITVFAGKPGSGKSYIMKFLYAYDDAMSSILNETYKIHYAFMDSEKEQNMLQVFHIMMSHSEIKNQEKIKEYIDTDDFIKAFEILDVESKNIKEENKPLFDMLKDTLYKLSEKQKKSLLDSKDEKFNLIFRNILESIFGDINQINDDFIYSTKETTINYTENKLTTNNLIFEENINGAIFVETPLILEFQKFLPTDRFKVPYHINSLLQELNKDDYSFTSEETNRFIHEFQASTSKIINGNITKVSQGFAFESDSGKNFNIVNASSGIKSIGLLQYLVKNKALKKGSTLFWEEPEVHLHPTWQLKMIDLFIELMNAGVKIVFSTHSPFMADYLNAKATRGKFEDRISYNLLSEKESVVSNTILNDENWKLLQDELLGSLEDIMWEYL
ncbi:MAG: ATP-binding protein [Campylobacterota bacterium]|nr:ATP-binding protein [Campylobacterota bacterium]